MDLQTLLAIDGIAPGSSRKKYALLKYIRSSGYSFDMLSTEDIERCIGISKFPPLPKTLMQRAERLERLLRQRHITPVCFADSQYPKLLKEIYDPPFMLYIQGSIPERQSLSIVGSRRVPLEGEGAAFAMGLEASYAGVPVVSGFARGVDIAAHRGAVQGQGVTIAVLGAGHFFTGPKGNLRYVKPIVECGGAVVSEYAPDISSQKWFFPERNRIISGLSLAVLLVGVPLRSGALITADFALDQGRDVGVYNIGLSDRWGAGGAALVQSGALKVTHLNEFSVFSGGDKFLFPRVAEVREDGYTIGRGVHQEIEGSVYRYKTKRFKVLL